MAVMFKDTERTIRCAEVLHLMDAVRLAEKLDQNFIVAAQFDPDSDRERLLFMVEMARFDPPALAKIVAKFDKFLSQHFFILPCSPQSRRRTPRARCCLSRR